jgi:hypothetical protein
MIGPIIVAGIAVGLPVAIAFGVPERIALWLDDRYHFLNL